MNVYISCFLVVVINIGCSSFREDVNEQIEQALSSNCDVNEKEFKEIESFIIKDKDGAKKLGLLSNNGTAIDNIALENFILVTKAYIKQKKNCNEIVINTGSIKKESIIKPKLYLERSGSMVYYDNRQSKGQFKSTLTKLLNNFGYLKPEKSLIYIVNDNVYSCNLDFDGLVRQSDIFNAAETRKGKGDYTDFNRIFRSILDSLNEGEMGIMFSDLIYSTKDMKEKNPTKILVEAENLTNNIFGSYANDYSVLVLKLQSDYIGNYYTFENQPISYNGLRPYYICFFAKNTTMNAFLVEEKYKQVRDFSKLDEFQNFYFFSNDKNVINPYYTIALRDAENVGHFNQDNEEIKEKKDYVHSIEDVEPKNDKLTINLQVDFSKLMLPEDFLVNPTNYEVDALKDGFKVIKVEAVKDMPNVTHKITISTRNAGRGKRNVAIKLKKYFPIDWITKSNSEDDRNTNADNFQSTTFGFKSMMTGIYSAYNHQNKDYYCILNITLNN
ncbi:MAG: hypothetical protein MUF58_09110 [Arcicella sp.]|jgi:hypothetical protein|nr:hypothetical protein [Arcicella sp.]